MQAKTVYKLALTYLAVHMVSVEIIPEHGKSIIVFCVAYIGFYIGRLSTRYGWNDYLIPEEINTIQKWGRE